MCVMYVNRLPRSLRLFYAYGDQLRTLYLTSTKAKCLTITKMMGENKNTLFNPSWEITVLLVGCIKI